MSERDIFSRGDETARQPETSSIKLPVSARAKRVQLASLWAAYGDALGWISELTNSAGLERRTRGRPLTEPIAWTRRVGGRSGVNANLPQGCYSDDTQLRLATSRAIRQDGFDVEAFAKVELPVWLSYGLGGGKSTIAAAEHLSQSGSTWWRNRFNGWTRSGGNGAAMRIQPHVWSSRNPEQPESYLVDVVRNAVCTHSHPTGMIGAVLHAQCVAYALTAGNAPSPDDLQGMLAAADELPGMIDRDRELAYWRIAFEEDAGSFHEAWTHGLDEARRAIATVTRIVQGTGEERYSTVIDGLGLREPARLGSGLLTSIAAAALAWSEPRPAEAMHIAANALGTDTDTIATMAGAILGATTDAVPAVDVLDGDLVRRDGDRLATIAAGGDPLGHRYPDLMHWVPPKARADALACARGGGLVVRGLGPATQLEDEDVLVRNRFRWRWVRLSFGQTLLIKGRERLPYDEAVPAREPRRDGPRTRPDDTELVGGESQRQRPYRRGRAPTRPVEGIGSSPDAHDIQDVVAYAREHVNDDETIGKVLRRVVRKGSAGQIAGFVAALVELLRESNLERRS